MGLVDLPLSIPIFPMGSASAGYNSTLLDASGEKAGAVFQVQRTGSITTVRFRLGTVTTGQTLRVGLYAVDGSGNPDTATAYGGMVAGTVTVADTDDHVEKVITLATAASATRGDVVAVVVEFDATVGNLNVQIGGSSGGNVAFGYLAVFNTGAWVKSGMSFIAALGYSDGSYYQIPGLAPFTVANTNFSVNLNSATADEYGVKFTHATPVRVAGIYVRLASAAGADFEANIYDGTTVLSQHLFDGDHVVSTSPALRGLLFNEAVVVPAEATRRISLRPTTTANLVFEYGEVGADAVLAACPGGLRYRLTRRLDQGAWDDSDVLAHLYMYPIIDQGHNGSRPTYVAGIM